MLHRRLRASRVCWVICVSTLLVSTGHALAQDATSESPPALSPSDTPASGEVRATTSPPTRGLWVGLGTAMDLHAHDPENAIGGGGTFMVAWRDTHLQLRLFSSVVGSDREVQSVGIEYGLGVDYPIYDWLDAGLYLGHRIASTAATDAWLEQSWFLGVQSAQRVWSITEHLHLWVREGIAPAGQRWRRAEAVDGRIRALEQRTDYQARFELGVFVQQEIR